MAQAVRVEAARPGEWEAALRLVFWQLDEAARADRVRTALQMLRRGELRPEGLLVARRHRLAGAVLCLPTPGACGLLWPPRTAPPHPPTEDALVGHALAWLRGQGCKIVQSILTLEERPLATPLERNGVPHVTDLWYFRHKFDALPSARGEVGLRYLTYSDGTADLFRRVLMMTYQGTLDCPEINGVRTADEILEGHRSQGPFDPGRWWLALDGARPVGLILLADVPEAEAWDVAYVGVVPEERRKGRARQMLCRALRAADAAGASQVTLAVDGRNRPAWDLYVALGFRPFEKRHVFLTVWR